jgi:Rrf2 family protein
MISTTSEYALRAMAYMAGLPRSATVLSRDVASATQIPRNYLCKVLLALRNAGMLESTRGAGGGYRLKKAPEEIYLIDIVELFEGSKAKPTCLLNNRQCSETTPCNAHRVWRELSMAYTGFLVSTTVAAIAGGPSLQTANLG